MGLPPPPEPGAPKRPTHRPPPAENDFQIERSLIPTGWTGESVGGPPKFTPPSERNQAEAADEKDETPPAEPAQAAPKADPPPQYEFFNEPTKERKRRTIFMPSPLESDDDMKPPPPQWRAALGRIASHRPTQIGVLIGLIVSATLVSHISQNAGVTSIRSIRRHAQELDGRHVKVRGVIGDVFPVGESYAFNLHHGRDTLVVFTRTRVPVPHQQVLVAGSVSTGFLEGVPRAALFETRE